MPAATLLNLCIAKTALLLKECYWPVGSYALESSGEHNPFSYLPSDINEELIPAVIRLAPSGTLKVKDLYPILSSGQIKNFVLRDIRLPTEEFARILSTLSMHSMKLSRLILQRIYFLEPADERYYQSMKSIAIESFLMNSPNLEHIEIAQVFDIKAIQHVRCLQYLKLNFIPHNKLFDLIPKIDDTVFIPNETISFIDIYESDFNIIPEEELAFLLQHCTKLTYIQNNIAGALELLHSEEFFSGSLTKEYKLSKYILGDTRFSYPTVRTASVTVIQIATVTCPQTRDLEILVNDHQAIAALADFKRLISISVCWEWRGDYVTADFQLGLKPVLEIIGSQLKHLSIWKFNNVDFEIIGRFCPLLVELAVEYDSEVNITSTYHAYFTCLTTLHLLCHNISVMKSDTLLFLLGNCKELTSLCLACVYCLTDELLTVLLRKNFHLKLKELSFYECSLTEQGLRLLVKSCPSLEYLCFCSPHLTFHDVEQIVHSVNPVLTVTDRL